MKWLFYSLVFVVLVGLFVKFKDKILAFVHSLGSVPAASAPSGTGTAGNVGSDTKITPSYGVITTAPLDGISQIDTPIYGGSGSGGSGLLGTASLNQQEPLDQQNHNLQIGNTVGTATY